MNSNTVLIREELEGFIELGMGTESLKLARRILAWRKPSAAAFQSALRALLIFEDHLQRWVTRVERSFDTLNSLEQGKCGSAMFSFFVSLARWERASRYRPKNPKSDEELMFSMWTCLNLRQIDEARSILNSCCRRLRRTTDPFALSCLLTLA
jgi:hypothetical protein